MSLHDIENNQSVPYGTYWTIVGHKWLPHTLYFLPHVLCAAASEKQLPVMLMVAGRAIEKIKYVTGQNRTKIDL